MVAASEVENNIDRRPDHLLGLRSMASAVLLRESEAGDSGFLGFDFTDFSEFDQLRCVHAGWHEEGRRIYLTCDEQGNVLAVFLDCLLKATRDFLDRSGVGLDEIDWFVPSQHSAEFVADFTAGMSINAQRVVNLVDRGEGNPSSSLFPLARRGAALGRFKRGDLVLAAIVCPGVKSAAHSIGCKLVRRSAN